LGQHPDSRSGVPEERTGFIRKVTHCFSLDLFCDCRRVRGLRPELMSAIVIIVIAMLVMIGGVYGAQAVRHQPVLNVAALFGSRP